MFFILDENNNPVQIADILEWGRWFENADNRRVALSKRHNVYVSTMFIGTGFIMFESMVFGGEFNEHQRRYNTFDEALQGHLEMVKLIETEMKLEPNSFQLEYKGQTKLTDESIRS